MERLRTYGFVAGFLAVPLTLYTVFVISPYAQAFQLSLTNWNGYSSIVQYVGLDNFGRLLTDEVFWRALRNHGLLLLVLPLVTIVIALFLAFLLNLGGGTRGDGMRGVWGSAFYRVV
ncbi:sugar ABC transporter permease, partial [Nonomuraea sp. NPDC004297]